MMLGVPTASADGAKENPPSLYWLAALFANGQLYLFDTQLGLAIPGPDGKGVATLAQSLKDDALLRKMDLEGRLIR